MKPAFASFVLAILFATGCSNDATAPARDGNRLTQINVSINNGDFEEALSEATRYTTDFAECDQGWRLRGWAHAKLDQLGAAVTSFEKAIALNPQDDNAYVGLGVVHRKEGNLDAARESYASAIRIVPDNAEAFTSLLVIEILDQKYQMAVDYGEKAWALRKDLASIPANLAIAYHFVGNDAKKKYYYEQAERLQYHRLETIKEIFDGTMVIE